MRLLSPSDALLILSVFGAVMVLVVVLRSRRDRTADSFLVADRRVSLVAGAFSIAVSWIWAPAVFLCSQQSYVLGLPGIFWFTAPNILCFFTFVPIALRLRRLMPSGYTLPEFIRHRYGGDRRVHTAFLVVFFGYQLGALVINCVAGAALLHAVSGLDPRVAVLAMAAVALAYSLVGGLTASVLTDVLQMGLILLVAAVLVPWCVVEAGGWGAVSAGLGGVGGAHRDLFDPWIAYSMGIPMTLGLIAGPISDQMFFQRALAVRRDRIAGTFVLGGLLFGVVPIALSLLGFLGADPALAGALEGADPQVIGAAVVGHLLPSWALLLFCVMALAGLASTLDSACCALSALGAKDVFAVRARGVVTDRRILSAARMTMLVMTAVGAGVALLQPRLLWVFLIYGALASAGLAPVVLSLFWGRLTAAGAFWAVVLSLAVGTPLSIVANVDGDPHLVVVAAIASVAIGLVVCLVAGLRSRQPPFRFTPIPEEPARAE